MTTPHPIRVADAAATDKLDPIMLEAIVKRTVLVLSPSESLSDIVQSSGEVALAVAAGVLGQLFFYDETDTTTADDGQTCLVDGSGHRYHLEDMATIHVSSVLGETDTPAVGPTVGDAYIVGTSPSGAWAANAKDVAIYTRRGWVFATPLVGMTVLNRDTDENRQFLDTGLWGAFATVPDAGSITPVSLSFPMGVAVEAVQNDPPVMPTEGLYYIVGTVPTGDFTGHANALATYVGSAWLFAAAYEGAQVYDRANDYDLTYNGSWAGAGGAIFEEFTSTAGGTWTKPSKGSVALVQVWGSGGSGGRAGSGDAAGGGGGGAYVEYLFKLSDLSSTVAITIGAGGVSRTADNTDGAAGGNSSFGTYLTAYGGGGGKGNISDAGGGGGGGGQGGAGSAGGTSAGGNGGLDGGGSAGGAGGSAGVAGSGSVSGGGGGGGNDTSGIGSGPAGGGGVQGGGGGGGGREGGSGGAGGPSMYGGGGGGGSGGAGGASKVGGAGGAGATGSSNATAGSQPGGGGGGSETGNSGKGGDGMVRVTVF